MLNFVENSEPPNTGLSGIRMVIFGTLFGSSFQMALAAIVLQTIQKPDEKSSFQMVGHFFTIWKPDRTFFFG